MGTCDGLRASVRTRGQLRADQLAGELKRQLVKAAKPHYKTGKMERAIKTRVTKSGDRWRVTAEVPVPEAKYTNDGTKPHIIRARGRVLAFYWPKLGKMAFFAFVRHPGTKATRWFSNVMQPANIRQILLRLSRT